MSWKVRLEAVSPKTAVRVAQRAPQATAEFGGGATPAASAQWQGGVPGGCARTTPAALASPATPQWVVAAQSTGWESRQRQQQQQQQQQRPTVSTSSTSRSRDVISSVVGGPSDITPGAQAVTRRRGKAPTTASGSDTNSWGSTLHFWATMLSQLFPANYVSPRKRFVNANNRCTKHSILCDVYTDISRGPIILGGMIFMDADYTPCQMLFQGFDSFNYMPYASFSEKFGSDRKIQGCSVQPTGFFAQYSVVGLAYIRLTTTSRPRAASKTGASGDLYCGVFWLPFVILDMPPINDPCGRLSMYVTADFMMYPTSLTPGEAPLVASHFHRLELIDFTLPMGYVWKNDIAWGYTDDTSDSPLYADGMCNNGLGERRRLPSRLTCIGSHGAMLDLVQRQPIVCKSL